MPVKNSSNTKKTASKEKTKKEKPALKSAPVSVVLSFATPGMSALHRTGLGGLAAVLHCLDKIKEKIDEEEPEFPFDSPLWREDFAWKIDKNSVELNFGKPENAALFLEWLFQFAFQIKDEMIFLPALYGVKNGKINVIPIEVRSRLQKGITLTFLQHGQTRKLGSEQTKEYEVDGKKISYEHKDCLSYTHQTAWKEWVNNKGELVLKNYSVQGPIHPGAVVRHAAYTSSSLIAQPLELVLPLIFALVGTLSVPINNGVGVLIIPYIDDLVSFSQNWHRVCPKTVKTSMIAGLGDASIQFELRRRGESLKNRVKIPGCEAVCFRPMPWATQQKSRCDTLTLEHIDPDILDLYDRVLSYFPPRLIENKKNKKEGKGKNAVVTETVEYFLADSVVRPFIADNLARGNYWFKGFTKQMTAYDAVSKKPLREKIKFEKEGLNKMINDEKLDWKLEGAQSVVLAVQESLKFLYGKKIAESKNLSQEGKNNRLEGEYEKWRIAFSGAKTQEQFRFALSDMFSRAKGIPVLQNDWQSVMKIVVQDWQLARDLALIGLAAYKGKNEGKKEE
ncbi:MAG: type I-MYXAN CRISPR-associated Cas8a1/Cmx1 [Planctomycetia bacterium]|nr:type I-MYXAN CRISPR-associated Cas8a1/Cmx1 [Planctomycetia bacterium]